MSNKDPVKSHATGRKHKSESKWSDTQVHVRKSYGVNYLHHPSNYSTNIAWIIF